MTQEQAAATEVAATETPVVETPPAVPEQTETPAVEEPVATETQSGAEGEGGDTPPKPKPVRRLDARAAMRERLRKSEQAARQAREQDGKFADGEARETQEQTETPPAEPEAKTDEAAEAAKVAESGAVEGTTTVSIELDARNPLYDQGIKTLEGVPKSLERAVRTLANAAVRGREAQEANAALEAAETEVARLQARLRLLESGEHLKDSPENDPEFQDLVKQIEKHYPGQTDKIKAAMDAWKRQQLSSVEKEAEMVAQRQTAARRFLRTVASDSKSKYPVWAETGELAGRMQVAVSQYGDYVDARNANLVATGRPEQPPSADEFFTWVDTNYVKDKRVQERLTHFRQSEVEAERQRIAQEERQRFAEEEKAKLEEAAGRHSTKPPSPPPGRSAGVAGPKEPSVPEAARQHGTRQRALRDAIRQRLSGS